MTVVTAVTHGLRSHDSLRVSGFGDEEGKENSLPVRKREGKNAYIERYLP